MRRMFLLAVIALFGNAMAQPDTVWSREYPAQSTSYFAIYSDESATILGGSRYYILPPPVRLQDAVAMRLDSTGNLIWSRQITNNSNANQGINAVFPREDGNYLFIGWIGPWTYYNIYYNPTIWCVSPDGDVEWSRSYQFDTTLVSPDILRDPFCSDETGYYIVGGDGTTGQGVLFRISLNGDSLWSRNISPRPRSALVCIARTNDDHLLIGGYGSSPGQVAQAFVIKTDTLGTIQSQWLPGIGSSRPLLVFQDGSEIVSSGLKESTEGVNWTWQVRLDSNCQLLHYEEQELSGSTTQFAQTRCDNSEILLATYVHGSGQALTRLRQDFEPRWQMSYSAGVIRVIKELEDGSFIWSGNKSSNVWVARTLHDNIQAVETQILLPTDLALHPAYPNPFNPNTTISFDLAREMDVSVTAYDILGNEVTTLVSGRMPAGTHDIAFDGAGLPSGIYFCRLEAGTFSQTQKLMLLK